MMKHFKNNNQRGFIGILAVIVAVAVTGGSIALGSAVVDSVHKRGCGDSYDSWRNGDIYADLADSDNLDAIDKAQKCQKSVHDAVKTAAPVVDLLSSASNFEGKLSDVIVDRMLDAAKDASDPEHTPPKKDKPLPPDVQAKVDEENEFQAWLAEPDDEPADVTGAFDGTWSGEGDTNDDASECVGTASLSFTIEDGEVTGKAVGVDYASAFSIKGTVDDSGNLEGKVKVLKIGTLGTFKGKLSNSSGYGTWDAPRIKCSGTFTMQK